MKLKELNDTLKFHSMATSAALAGALPIFYHIVEASMNDDTEELQKISDWLEKKVENGNQYNISLNNCSYNSFAGIHILTGSSNLHIFQNVLIRNVQWCILDEGTSNNIHDNFCLLPAPTILTSSQTINTDSLLIDWTDVNGAWFYNVYVNDILNTTAVASEATVQFSYDGTHSVTVAPVHNVTEGDRSVAISITVDIDTSVLSVGLTYLATINISSNGDIWPISVSVLVVLPVG